jgi:hypothetical protein
MNDETNLESGSFVAICRRGKAKTGISFMRSPGCCPGKGRATILTAVEFSWRPACWRCQQTFHLLSLCSKIYDEAAEGSSAILYTSLDLACRIQRRSLMAPISGTDSHVPIALKLSIRCRQVSWSQQSFKLPKEMKRSAITIKLKLRYYRYYKYNQTNAAKRYQK